MPGISILIEGVDLAGKSTLAKSLPGKLNELGFAVRQSRNSLCPDNPIAPIADIIRKEPHAGNVETGTLFLASHLWDARNFSPIPNGTVHLQDSCWVRTLAHHALQGTPDIPAMLRREALAFPRFDIAIFLTADLTVRQKRLHQREVDDPGSNDNGDRLVITNPQKFKKLDEQLNQLCKEFFTATCIDTSALDKDGVLNEVLGQVLPMLGVPKRSAAHAP